MDGKFRGREGCSQGLPQGGGETRLPRTPVRQVDTGAIALWEAVRFCEEGTVLKRPGIVVGGYCPAGFAGTDDFARTALTFRENGHQARLEQEYGITVDVFGSTEETRRGLRPLAGAQGA